MLSIGSIVWGVRDIGRALEFWTAALDYRPRDEPGDDWVVLIPRRGEGPQLALDLVDSPRPRRHHLDLYADDQWPIQLEEPMLPGGVIRFIARPTGVDVWVRPVTPSLPGFGE